jgi:hypothetical protein
MFTDEYVRVYRCDRTLALLTLRRSRESFTLRGRIKCLLPAGTRVDRRCRSITAPVKENHPPLSWLLSAVICGKEDYKRLLPRRDAG